MDFLKEFPASDFHPQIRKAGFWGATVFRALCRMSARHDLDGEIPPQYQDLEDLADVLRCQDEVVALRDGVTRCMSVGLLRRESLGESHGEVWIIDGWASIYTEKHKTNAERQSAWREQKKAQRLKAAESQSNAPMSANVRADISDVTMSALQDMTRHDKTDSFAGEKPPAPAKVSKAPGRPKLERPPPDPRHSPLVHALTEAYQAARGAPYPFTPRDARSVSELLATGTDPPVVVGAWTRALGHVGFPSVATLAELVAHLPHFVGTGPPERQARQGRASAADRDWTLKPKTRMTEFGEELDI